MVTLNHNQEMLFNEAALKMRRIDKLQDFLNMVRINPLSFNQDFNKYNYEIMISCLISLCYEAAPLMKKGELQEFHLLRKTTNQLMQNNPIHKIESYYGINNPSSKKKINHENYYKLESLLYKFEDFAREQIDKHGLSGQKKENMNLAVTH